MIKLFEIKNKKVDKQDTELLEKYKKILSQSKEQVIKQFSTSYQNGLTTKEAEKRLEQNGENVVIQEKKRNWLYFFIKSFEDKFIYILIILSIINYFASKDTIGTIIILCIGIISAIIKFVQNYSTYRFNQKLKAELFTTATVLREKEETVKVEKIVRGDIVHLNAGTMIPADVMILESKDLFINQAVFTGESIPVEKTDKYEENDQIFSISNLCLMGTSVISGSATAIVINTGFETYLGGMGKQIDNKKELTNFQKGMDGITKLLIRYMVIVSIAVFIIYAFIRKDFMEAMLFALSVAVGITPTMLPMIVNVNLTKGTKTLAKEKTLVKNTEAIQNLGAIDVLCTDKTGTLTMDKIVLQKYIDVTGKEDLSILEYAYLNSYYGTGMKNLVDRAIVSYGDEHDIKNKIDKYIKVDEIPFDYTRKRMSVVVEQKNGAHRMITKGALEEILKICTKVKLDDKIQEITEEMKARIQENAKVMAQQGMQVIALSSKREYRGKNIFDVSDESDMIFIGFVAFLDPPKKEVKETIQKLKEYGVETKIITGDNQYATQNICNLVGIENNEILIGTQVDNLSDEELAKKWLNNGAQPTEVVGKIFKAAGIEK